MFAAIKETRFAKRVIESLLKSHSAVTAENPGLSGEALYREILLHAQMVDPSRVDRMLWEAEDSVDEWTTHGDGGLGFRQVAHFVVISQFLAAGHKGTVVSIKNIVYTMIPAEL